VAAGYVNTLMALALTVGQVKQNDVDPFLRFLDFFANIRHGNTVAGGVRIIAY